MAKKGDAQTWMVDVLGKTVAEAVLKKADRMAGKGASVAKIEKAISADVMRHIKTHVRKGVMYRVHDAGVMYRASGPRGPRTK